MTEIKKRRSESSNAKQVGGFISKSIGPYWTEYIDKLIYSGRYLTVAEVLRDALRAHEQKYNKVETGNESQNLDHLQ